MIGQSVINVSSGGRGRLSTFSAGAFLLVFILVLSDWLVLIPMGALVAVMIMVSIGTFDWRSLPALAKAPKSESFVMLVTVGAVVLTHDLSIGVIAGVVLSALFFARKVADHAFMEVEESHGPRGRTHTYVVSGSLFFVTVQGFLNTFDFQEDVDRVVLDLSSAHVWDGSAVDAIDRAALRFARRGVDFEVVGLNEQSQSLLDRLAIHDKPNALALAGGH
jgi:SulP family sulfate permease